MMTMNESMSLSGQEWESLCHGMGELKHVIERMR